MAKRNNVAAVCMQAIVAVFFMVLGFGLVSCSKETGGTDNRVESGEYAITGKSVYMNISVNVNNGDGEFTFTVGEKSEKIKIHSIVEAESPYQIGEEQKAVDFVADGDLKVDGLIYTQKFIGTDEHPVKTVATQDKLTVEIDGVIGAVTIEGATMKSVALTDNTALQPEQGERERMTTPDRAVWTGKATLGKKEVSFELNPSTNVVRFIPEGAPTVVKYEITPSENRTINSWNGDVLITAVMSDGSRVEVGNDPVAMAESWVCTSDWSVTVSKAEQTTGKLTKVSSTSENFRKDGVRGYYTGKYVIETWEGNVNVNGKTVKNTFVAKYVSNVEYHMFDRDEKATFTNATSTATIDAGTITDNKYSAIGTNVVGTVSRQATAPGTITVEKVIVKHYWDTKTQKDVLTEAARDCSADYVREYSDGTVDRHNYTFHYNRAKSAGSYFEVWPETAADNLGSVTTSESASSKTDAHVTFNLRAFKVSVPVQVPGNAQTDVATFTEAEDIVFSVTVNGEKDELKFNNPSHSASATKKELQKIGEDEEVTTYFHSADLTWNYGNTAKSVTCTGKIFIPTGHGSGEPEAPKAVIGGGIVSPKPGLSDSMWYVGYLIELNNGKVRPLIVDKNGQNVKLGDEFDKNSAWNGSAYINGTLYPVLATNTGSMLKYTYKAGVSYAISAVNAGDGFNWNHATVENVTGHYKPVITQQGSKTILTLQGVSGWSMEWQSN